MRGYLPYNVLPMNRSDVMTGKQIKELTKR